MWKTIEQAAHRLGFTRNEAAVILFLVTVVLTGQAVGMWNNDQTQLTDYSEQYRQHDLLFADRSGSLPARRRVVSGDQRSVAADRQPAAEQQNWLAEQQRMLTDGLNTDVETPDNPVSAAAVVNINTATANELETLPGIGPVTAQRIIDYRKQAGNFSTVEDIMKVKSIGPKKLEKLRQFICTE